MLRSFLLLVSVLNGCAYRASNPAFMAREPLGYVTCNTPTLVVIPMIAAPEIEDATRAAIKRWNGLSGRDLLLMGGRAILPASLGIPTGFILVRTATPAEAYTWSKYTRGKFRWRAQGGCLLGGQVLIRRSMYSQEDVYLRNLITHELGHALGLDDRYDDTEHIMSWHPDAQLAYHIDLTPSKPTLSFLKSTYQGD